MTLFNGLIESLQRFVFCLSTQTEKFTEQEIDQTESFTGPECVTEKWRERVMKEPSTDEEKRKTTSSDDIRILFSVAEPLAVKEARRAAVEIKPLPSVEEPSLADRIFQLIPPADRIKEPILVHQNPTSAAVIQKPIVQVDPTCAELNPQPATSPLDSTPQLVLMDTDIECEYVKNTEKTISPGEMKTKQHQPQEAVMKPKRILCWMENDSEVQEPVPPVQMVEVQAFTVEDEENSGEKKFDSRRIIGDASRKGFEERVIRLFHVNPSYRPETQRCLKGQKKPWNKSNSSLFLLDWAEKTVRKTEEKRKRKESEKLQRQLLHNRYQNDPKLRHLIINKHNRFYKSYCNVDFSFTV